VTGQQVGLFLGPLFTVYKAASAIRVARALDAVPVFWLQTEDHDLPEIAAITVAPGCERLVLPASADSRVSVAHLALPPEIGRCLDELRGQLAGHVHADAHHARLARHYVRGAPWAAAFAGVLAELFADEGMVFIDPRDPALGPVGAPVHERALRQAAKLAAAIQGGPVHVRPGAPLSFFHPEGPAGPRHRLEPDGDAFAEVGGDGRHALEDLLAALEADPRRFSTSALLRPILQDTLLPTVAYVGGPAEVAYFAQLPPLYAAYELTPPRVVARARFRIVDDKTRKLLERLRLTCDEAALPEDDLLARCRPQSADAAELERRLLESFDRCFVETRLAPELSDDVARARRAIEKSVAKLGTKVRRAQLHRDGDLVASVRRLRAVLAPGGVPQERVYGLPYFAARHGDRALIEKVIAAAEPFDARLKDLTP
jgi:bacillithiol biosynthesis cysteine-adding enzyme BshC